jgi:hypothetical protein
MKNVKEPNKAAVFAAGSGGIPEFQIEIFITFFFEHYLKT